MKPYELITSPSNALIKKIIKLKDHKTLRSEEHVTLVEGKNLLIDLLPQKQAKMLFVTESCLPFAQHTEKLYLVTDEVMKKISTVESPEGMLGLFPIQESSIESIDAPCLILDGLQDPGNVGTLLRTASAFGIQHVISIEPCCDLWHPKVMRAAKGAHYLFSSIVTTSWETLLLILKDKNIIPLVAHIQGCDIRALHVPQRWALVLGSEARGPTLPQTTQALWFTIAMKHHIDSLNVAQAGAIALYQFMTQKTS